ncbi:MAG: DUF3575 domain-containing protein [Bacteroidales bacterium]|nr:DUF3575 domain-containing protein [Bacteroidales bacterium]
MSKLFSVIFAIILYIVSLSAAAEDAIIAEQKIGTTITTHSKILYPVNKIDIYEDYMSNPRELDIIKRHLAISPRIDSITIYSFASPEGRYEFNKWLAEERGQTAKRYILSIASQYRNIPDSIIRVVSTPENWSGLRQLLIENYHRADSSAVMEIMDRPGITDEQRKSLLKKLSGGESWQYIIRYILPELRYATWSSVWEPVVNYIPPRDVTSVRLTEPQIQTPQLQYPVVSPPQFDTKTILALKSNLLYDALTWLNYSIEVPFAGNKFSALLYHQFPWWTWGQNNNEYCVRFLGVGAEAKWWFLPQPRSASLTRVKRDRLVGHYIGIYAESGKYDFELKRDICYQGEYWSTGLSYGYSMPISKHLNMEFSLSVGYASIAHRGYTPSVDYSILWRDDSKIGRWHYLGLTKAQISLVIPFTIKVKKGGNL